MPFDVPGHPTSARRKGRLLLATLLLLAAGVALLALLSQQVERTPDELNYQYSGRRLLAGEPPIRIEDRFQGPLIFLATQLTDAGGRLTDFETLARARLGMLLFPAMLLAVLAFWTRAALGPRAGCLAAALGALNPSLLAYGPLLSSDVAFTAMAALAGFLTWSWLQRPALWRLVVLGLAVGGLVATKYTATISVVGLLLVVFGHVLLGFDPRRLNPEMERRGVGRRLLSALAALSLVAVIALATLYSAYLFTVAPASGVTLDGLQSGMLQSIRDFPGGRLLLGLMPDTFVRGIDYQSGWAGVTETGSFGDLRGNHWAYYPVTLLFKIPAAVWVIALLALLLRRTDNASRGLWTTMFVPALLLLGYCSATRALQMGVRYVLPMVPAVLMLAASFASRRAYWGQRATVLTALVLGASTWHVVAGWPHFVGYFNVISGGPASGFRVVADGNCAWGQQRASGRALLEERYPGLLFLGKAGGPRFGRIAVWCEDLKAPDPRHPGRCYHWLTRFDPVDSVGAAWLVFDVTVAEFERRARAGESRAAVDLAFAWLREGKPSQARAALMNAGPSDPAATRAKALVDRFEALDDDDAARDSLATSLAEIGRYDLALTLIDRSRRENAELVYWLLWRGGRQREAIEHLDRIGAGDSRSSKEVGLLALSLYNGGDDYPPDPMRALEIMDKHARAGLAPAPDTPEGAFWSGLRTDVEAAVQRELLLEGLR